MKRKLIKPKRKNKSFMLKLYDGQECTVINNSAAGCGVKK